MHLDQRMQILHCAAVPSLALLQLMVMHDKIADVCFDDDDGDGKNSQILRLMSMQQTCSGR